MSSRSELRPASFARRLARGELRLRDAASIALAGTALCAAALAGLDALLVPPAPAEAHALAGMAPADPRALAPYVGTWVSEEGVHLIVAPSGAVWADAGGLIGAARLDGARLVVQGPGFRCAYAAEPPRAEALDWHPLDAPPGSPCPAGRYTRRHVF